MWNNAGLPALPGYSFATCNRGCNRPCHAIGWTAGSEASLTLWIMQSSVLRNQSELLHEFNSPLSRAAPAAALGHVNDSLCQRNSSARGYVYVCGCVMVLDSIKHTLTITDAGLGLPLLRTQEGSIVQFDMSESGIPMGMIPAYEYSTLVVPLPRGTSVVWTSPYTMQIFSPTRHLYGSSRFHDLLTLAPGEPQRMVEAIAADIEEFICGTEQSADICIVCCQRDE